MSAENQQHESVYYTLSYKHGVDAKRRVQVPAKWRNSGESRFSIIYWPGASPEESCLLALPPVEWEALVARLRQMPFSDVRADSLRRLIGTKSDHVVVDSAGRISLPESLAQAAGLEKEALFIGLVHRFQIWNPARYEAVQNRDSALTHDAFSLI